MIKNLDNINIQIMQYLKLIDKKWKNGILKFKEKIRGFKDKINNKDISIRSSIYGDIIIDEKERILIDSFYLQRQREILHKGFAYYVYPEARHSRFEHSLGVFWIIKKLLESKFWKISKIDEKDRMNLICAALLHDIGHGPFSHFSEFLLDFMGITSMLRPKDKNSYDSRYHERRIVSMILNQDYLLKKIGVDSYYLDEALKKLGANPESVTKMILGNPKEKFASLINGSIDADKLDYYQRDAFFTGTPAGTIDAEFLMRNVKFNKKNVYFLEKTFSSIIQMFFNREYVYSIVSYHPVIRTIQSMMAVAFISALSILSPKTQVEVLLHLDMMDDNDFWVILDIIASNISSDKNEKKIFEDILERFRSRDFYKRWFTLSLDECKELQITKIKEEKDISSYFYPLKFTRNDVHNGKLRKNEAIIFEISPKPKSRDERKEKIIKNFKNIFIENRQGNIVNLYERLEKDKETIVEGLASFQHQLNNALLLHPRKKEKNVHKIPKVIIEKLRIEVGGFSKDVRVLLKNELESLRGI